MGDSMVPMQVGAFNLKQHKKADHLKIVIRPKDLHPEFLREFEDEDSVMDFLESLSEHECSIIKTHCGEPDILRQIRDSVFSDLDETSKDLAME